MTRARYINPMRRISAALAASVFLPLAALAAPAAQAPVVQASKTTQLDKLFAALAKAESGEDADPLESQIEMLFRQSGSATIDLLMTRGESALKSSNPETAAKLFDAVTQLAPDFSEGWHRKAQVQALSGDDAGALASLQKVLLLNPRNFNALANLGGMLADYGDKKGALAAYRKAHALTPRNEEVNQALRRLTREVEGEKI